MKLKLAIIIAIVSVGLHLYLTNHYHEMQLGASDGPSSCNINATFNCNAEGYNKLQGLPFTISELAEKFETILK